MKLDPIRLEIIQSLLVSVCEEMGEQLKLTAHSPNIRERQDFSCALFDSQGEMISQAAHIPVHLGSMGEALRELIAQDWKIKEGDVFITNDPYKGGTHLPDITVITPVFFKKSKPLFFFATRAHHSDIGGIAPGSMSLSKDVRDEGVFIPLSYLYQKGRRSKKMWDRVIQSSRVPKEREGDLLAQLNANRQGMMQLERMVKRYGRESVVFYAKQVIQKSQMTSKALLKRIPNGEYEFSDVLDDDGYLHKKIKISLKLKKTPNAFIFDFRESAPQTPGPMNATRPVVLACIQFCLNSIYIVDQIQKKKKSEELAPRVSIKSVDLKLIRGSCLDAKFPAPVAGGNVETSQRIVDVILGAFAQAVPELVSAASQGTMNNISFGGFDPRLKRPFAYYETLGGGGGASQSRSGGDAIQTHMTNTMNTPIEVMELELPVRVLSMKIRKGKHASRKRGGFGIVKEIQFLSPAQVSLLTERRATSPYGLGRKASSGQKGKNVLVRKGVERTLPGKTSIRVQKGDILRVSTPGGGAYSLASPRQER